MSHATHRRTLTIVALAGLLAVSTAGAQTFLPGEDPAPLEATGLSTDEIPDQVEVPTGHGGPGAYAIVQLTNPPVAAVVEPLSDGQTVEEFYDYGGNRASANVPEAIVQPHVSTLFLFQGPEGLSLVVIHDDWGSLTSATAQFEFSGLPEDGTWAVKDDRYDPRDSFGQEEATWGWDGARTDGGAYRGLFGLELVTIDATLGGGLDEWHFVSGEPTDPERTELDPDETLYIVALA